jgi:hypothetical protein
MATLVTTTPVATTRITTTSPVATTRITTTPVATKKDVVKEEEPVLNIGALTGIIIFYVIIISISTYTGYICGKENSLTALGISAGFCLSTILCILLWVQVGQKTAGVCF